MGSATSDAEVATLAGLEPEPHAGDVALDGGEQVLVAPPVGGDQAERGFDFPPSYLYTHTFLRDHVKMRNGNCPYLAICKRFWISLALPEHYFLYNEGLMRIGNESSLVKSNCYCPACYRASSATANEAQNVRGPYNKSGVPPKDYALPLGWVVFPLQQLNSRGHHRKKRGSGENPDSNQRQTNERENSSLNASLSRLSVPDSNTAEIEETNENGGDWHVAYHASKAAFIRKILDNGELTPICEFGLDDGGRSSRKPKASKEDDSDATPLLFSPTLRYVGDSEVLCPSVQFKDNRTLRNNRSSHCRSSCINFKAKVAFQLEVHPGSYKVGPPTSKMQEADALPPTVPPDSHFKLDETEWLTKERGNTAITALLIQLQIENSSN